MNGYLMLLCDRHLLAKLTADCLDIRNVHGLQQMLTILTQVSKRSVSFESVLDNMIWRNRDVVGVCT